MAFFTVAKSSLKHSGIFNKTLFFKRNASLFTAWPNIENAPMEETEALRESFRDSKSKLKVNLSVDGYRDDDGKPWVLPSVRAAEECLFNKNETDIETDYPPTEGYRDYRGLVAELAFGDGSNVLKECLNSTVSTASGTAALRLGAEFFSRWYEPSKTIYVANPTPKNYVDIFQKAGLQVQSYTYYNYKDFTFNFKDCMENLSKIPERSVVLLQSAGHNPTGHDVTHENWREICKLFKSRKLLPFFDMHYQGVVSGDVDVDAFAIRHFVCRGITCALAQSFSANFGLYGERAGAFTLVNKDVDEANRVGSQLNVLTESMYLVPPANPMRIITQILSNQQLKAQWLCEIKAIAERHISMRRRLVEILKSLKNPHDWSHIMHQNGLMSSSGLRLGLLERLRDEYQVFMTDDGRMSITALNTKNIEYVANAIHEVTKDQMLHETSCD